MKVAVVLFRDAVCPRFACATQLLLATVDQGRVTDRKVIALEGRLPTQYAHHIASLGVQTLICGGIHRRFLHDLQREGIQVIWGVIGSAEEALAALSTGALRPDQFLCRPNRPRGGPRGGRVFDHMSERTRCTPPLRRRVRGGGCRSEGTGD